ncbi:LacI family DNA-binding transcriptional regulator [Ruania zhangjianzhongii]|uniref:LacI family DNA-binding transcriptional regulator n=1 Tax=Ruania zhangjianzhongii TaxID=2603206 RepID=UPI0011CC6C03|nr:LacI family DNA-binding transcriptional regulator [Ruania zhangjianzhongii]
MRQMATQKDIARIAGVSASAVSAVLNGTTHTRMSEATRARVEAAIAEVGYVPNGAARALRRRQAGTIAVVVENLENPVYKELFHGIYDAAEERGWAIVLGDTMWMRSGSHFLARLLGQGSVDAIVLRSGGLIDEEVLGVLRSRPTPVVLVEYQSDDHDPWVSGDEVAAGRMAAGHLIEAGHTDIAFVGGKDIQPLNPRHEGYVGAMKRARLKPRPPLFSGYGAEAGATGLAMLQAGESMPTAVVVNNVMSAVGLLGAAADAGVHVPRDLSVVGIHDAEIAELVRPRLTTVLLPMRELGIRAVEQVSALLSGTATRLGVVADPSPRIVARESVMRPIR